MVFLDRKQRHEITGRLNNIITRLGGDPLTPGLLKSPFVGRLSAKVSSAFSAKVLSGFNQDELSIAQRKWQSREISNVSLCSVIYGYDIDVQAVHISEHSQPSIRAHSERCNSVPCLPYVIFHTSSDSWLYQ